MSDKLDHLYYIHKFDDGNERFQYMVNEWMITSPVFRGKVSLLNVNGTDVISSISFWKILAIENRK
jgi:hypothetical protein